MIFLFIIFELLAASGRESCEINTAHKRCLRGRERARENSERERERERINSTRVSKRKQSKTESHWCNHQSLKRGKRERERDINT